MQKEREIEATSKDKGRNEVSIERDKERAHETEAERRREKITQQKRREEKREEEERAVSLYSRLARARGRMALAAAAG